MAGTMLLPTSTVLGLWQAVDESSWAYKSGKWAAMIFVVVIILVILFTSSRKSRK
jgi:hypothetical protein